MPYKDPNKRAEYLIGANARRRLKRQGRRAEREEILGHHTNESLDWPKRKLTEIESAWLAACIDCEGCISLGSYWNTQRQSYNFHVNISLQMTDPAIPNRLSNLCGGGVYLYERVAVKHKSLWQWHLAANGARWLLPQIRDNLMVKQKQADLLLEFLTISKRGVSSRAEYNPRAQEIRAEMKMLNQRGIPTSHEGARSEPA